LHTRYNVFLNLNFVQELLDIFLNLNFVQELLDIN